MRRSAALLVFTSVLIITSSFAGRAAAGGLEYTGAGAQALGRGGAVTARADDPMTLSYNPAGLAELRGSQLLLDVNIASMHACVDPVGYYGWGAYSGGGPSKLPDGRGGYEILNLGDPGKTGPGTAEDRYYRSPLDTVCMSQHVVPIPQLIATTRVTEDLGIGFGLVFPAATPQGQWGDNNGMVRGATGELRPAATRYMMLNAGTIGIFPTLGAGYRLTRWLRLGASFEWGMVWADNTSMAAVQSGTSPSNDIIAHIKAHDYFVPGFTGSVHVVPNDNWDIVGAFKWQDAIRASGSLDLTTGVYNASGIATTTREQVLQLKQNMPWKARVGVRYSSRLAPRPTGTGKGQGGVFLNEPLRDPLQDERWDVEVDAEYQGNSVNQYQQVDYRPNQLVYFTQADGVHSATFTDPSKPYTQIDKRWKDQISLRAGGTYNIVPGHFAVSAGVHYENRGVDPSYMQIDYWPLQRIGLHGGVIFRLAGSTDLVVSYAHIIQETLVVGAPTGQDASTIYTEYTNTGRVTAIDKHVGTLASRDDTLPVLTEPNPTKGDGQARLMQVVTKTQGGQPPWIVNSGTYRSGIDVLAVGIHSHF